MLMRFVLRRHGVRGPLGWLQVRRGDERVRQDLLPGHAADDARAGQGHLGHLRVVQVSRAALQAPC